MVGLQHHDVDVAIRWLWNLYISSVSVLCPLKRRIVIIALALITPWRSASWTLMLPYDGHGIYKIVLCPVERRIVIIALVMSTN